MPMASLKPLRNTAPSSASRSSVMTTCWPCRTRLEVRVLDQVGGGVGGRQGDGDHEVGGGETEQDQDEELALPERSSRSSIAIEPSPCGLSPATRR